MTRRDRIDTLAKDVLHLEDGTMPDPRDDPMPWIEMMLGRIVAMERTVLRLLEKPSGERK